MKPTDTLTPTCPDERERNLKSEVAVGTLFADQLFKCALGIVRAHTDHDDIWVPNKKLEDLSEKEQKEARAIARIIAHELIEDIHNRAMWGV